MVEVISLLSSPLKSPKPRTQKAHSKSVPRTDDFFTLYSDDFETTGELSFTVSSSSKRRKLNGIPAKYGSSSRRGSRATSLQPAFDDGLPGDGSIITKQFKVTKSTEVQFSDPITFSSSAPESRTAQKALAVTSHDLSDDLPEDIFGQFAPSASQPGTLSISQRPLSERTANLLAELSQDMPSRAVSKASLSRAPAKRPGQFRMVGATSAGASVADDIFSSSPPKAAAAKRSKPKPSEGDKAARAAQRAQATADLKATKTANKEAEKERMRVEKEEKAREKQKADDIAEVNKKKTDKKVTTKEMILDMSRGFQGNSAGNQIEEYMKELEVEVKYFDEEINLTSTTDSVVIYPGNVVKWRRKVEAVYNEDEDQWERITRPRNEQADHVLVHLSAVEFATIAAQPASLHASTPIDETAMKANLDKHIDYLQSQVKGCKPIYLIEGLESWNRKNATAKNRAYTAAVRAQDEVSIQAPASSQTARPRKKKNAASSSLDLSHMDAELIERLQLHLQLHPLRPLIHLTTSASSTATWIKIFTEHISTVPYRRLKLSTNLSSASFCMDSGQVKTGENALDTYVRMLQEVQRVTPSMAYGIAGQYGNVRALVSGFKKEGPLMLEDVRKSANKDGALSERRLGPQVSKRLYKVFMGLDPGSMDGIA
jgi:crossover junction endonuclease EME1